MCEFTILNFSTQSEKVVVINFVQMFDDKTQLKNTCWDYPNFKGNVIKSFTFNVVFEPEATQKDVFENCGIEQMVDLALAGYSTTCICYGQTGSGKTHTLSGPPNLVSSIIL